MTWIFSNTNLSYRTGVPHGRAAALPYPGARVPGRRRIIATVPSSSPLPYCFSSHPASYAGDISSPAPSGTMVCPKRTPSLAITRISPLHRDSLDTVSPIALTEMPGGGVAVPIFAAVPRRSR